MALQVGKQDTIEFTILEDGTISIVTDQVSGANHVSADQLLRMIEEVMGGKVDRKKRNRIHVNASGRLTDALHAHAEDGHTHEHGQEHQH